MSNTAAAHQNARTHILLHRVANIQLECIKRFESASNDASCQSIDIHDIREKAAPCAGPTPGSDHRRRSFLWGALPTAWKARPPTPSYTPHQPPLVRPRTLALAAPPPASCGAHAPPAHDIKPIRTLPPAHLRGSPGMARRLTDTAHSAGMLSVRTNWTLDRDALR